MATTKEPPAKAAPEQPAKPASLENMSLSELGQEFDRLDSMIFKLRDEREVVSDEIRRRVGGPAPTTPAPTGSNGVHKDATPAPAKTAPTAGAKTTAPAAKKSAASKGGSDDEDKPAAKPAKGQWKPAILVFLRDRQEEGSRLKPITLHCIEKVRAGDIQTKVKPDQEPAVAQNVSQSLNAMKKAEEVRQDDDDKTYYITQLGLNWLEENGL